MVVVVGAVPLAPPTSNHRPTQTVVMLLVVHLMNHQWADLVEESIVLLQLLIPTMMAFYLNPNFAMQDIRLD